MKANVGSYDAGFRFILGCFVAGGAVHGFGWWSLLGVALILSAACEFCPLYGVFHVNTAERERRWEERHRH